MNIELWIWVMIMSLTTSMFFIFWLVTLRNNKALQKELEEWKWYVINQLSKTSDLSVEELQANVEDLRVALSEFFEALDNTQPKDNYQYVNRLMEEVLKYGAGNPNDVSGWRDHTPAPPLNHCGKCGMDFRGVTGYVCGKVDCPNGLNGPQSSSKVN